MLGSMLYAPRDIRRYSITDLCVGQAYSLNAIGEVVGAAGSDMRPSQAFLWRNGNKVLLDTPEGMASEAHGINKLGQIVGQEQRVYEAAGGTRAIGWRNGKRHYLDHLTVRAFALDA